jgi:hypothetical protein
MTQTQPEARSWVKHERAMLAAMKVHDACSSQAAVVDLEQPAPKPNGHPAVWDMVLADMVARDRVGRARYGTPLQPHNGRDALTDAYAEALDLCAYLRQAIFERDGK